MTSCPEKREENSNKITKFSKVGRTVMTTKTKVFLNHHYVTWPADVFHERYEKKMNSLGLHFSFVVKYYRYIKNLRVHCMPVSFCLHNYFYF